MRRHISCTFPLAALSALAICPLAHGQDATLIGKRSVPDRLPSEARPLHADASHRRLANDDDQTDDAQIDDAQQYQHHDDQYYLDDAAAAGDDDNDYVVSSGSLYYDYDADADGGYRDDDEGSVSGFQSYVQNKAEDAGTKAWEFYESPPSDWATDQWDLVFGLAVSVFALCCMGSACCAYHCLFNDDDDATKEWQPKRPKGEEESRPTLRPRRFGFGRKNHRDKFGEDHYRQYQEEDDEETATVGTLNSRASTAVTGYTGFTGFTGYTEGDTLGDDETKATMFTGISAYEPPNATSSLADYTSVQREKEAMIMEEWKRAHEPKSKSGSGEDDDEDDDEVLDLDIDPTPTSAEDDWDEDDASKETRRSRKSKEMSRKELDLALGRSDERQVVPGEDKLLEAREHQHNLVGYYLED